MADSIQERLRPLCLGTHTIGTCKDYGYHGKDACAYCEAADRIDELEAKLKECKCQD